MTKWAALVLVAVSGSVLLGCAPEPQPTEGDAEITKTIPQNANQEARARRERAGALPRSAAPPR